jgi:hypothetical protein
MNPTDLRGAPMTSPLPRLEELQAQLDMQRDRLSDLARRKIGTMRMIDSAIAEAEKLACGEPLVHMQCEACGAKTGVTEDANDGCQLCDHCRWIYAHPTQCPECGEAKELRTDEYCRSCERRFNGE